MTKLSSSGIFISYRRDDAAYPAGWLFERLTDYFGSERVFKDLDSIRPGEDFVAKITQAIGSCFVLLALIGPRWLTAEGPSGRRLDDPRDWVRMEIETGLRRGVLVIPVLVDGARMPPGAVLPGKLKALASRQAVELSPHRFASDAERLLRVLSATLEESAMPSSTFMGAPQVSSTAGREPGDTEMTNIRMVVARSKFLARLQPNFEYAGKGFSGYDTPQVDKFLKTAHTLASKDMAELQVYLETASRNFVEHEGQGYFRPNVSSYLRDLDEAVDAYAMEISAAEASGGHSSLRPEDVHRAMEKARSRFLPALRSTFQHAGTSFNGYDISQVDEFLETSRALASKDMAELQAYLAFTPRGFVEYEGKGYFRPNVRSFMRKLDMATTAYAEEIARLL